MPCRFCRRAREIAERNGGFTGAVIEVDGHIIGEGVPNELKEGSRAIDAEAVAVLWAFQTGVRLHDATLHLTGHFWPCREQCLPLLAYCGITQFCIDPLTKTTNPDCKHHKPNE